MVCHPCRSVSCTSYIGPVLVRRLIHRIEFRQTSRCLTFSARDVTIGGSSSHFESRHDSILVQELAIFCQFSFLLWVLIVVSHTMPRKRCGSPIWNMYPYRNSYLLFVSGYVLSNVLRCVIVWNGVLTKVLKNVFVTQCFGRSCWTWNEQHACYKCLACLAAGWGASCSLVLGTVLSLAVGMSSNNIRPLNYWDRPI